MKEFHSSRPIASLAMLSMFCLLGVIDIASAKTPPLTKIPQPLRNALSYASLAPSSHNAQMWKVSYSVSRSAFTVMLDRSRALRKVDPLDREGYISIGAYVQTMEVALDAFGYSPVVEIMEKNGEAVATVTLRAFGSAVPDKARIALLEQRHTDKRNFKINAIDDQARAAILATDQAALSFIPRGSESYAYLQEGIVKAMEKQSANQEKRNELSDWLRYSDKERDAKRDGLPAEQLGITGIKKFFYYFFVDKEYAQGDSYAKQGVDMTREQAENNAGFFILTGGNTPEELIRTGMSLQKAWLMATRYQVAIHPMSQLLEEEPYRSEIQKRLHLKQSVQMVLRAGYVPKYLKNNKIRRDIDQFISVEP